MLKFVPEFRQVHPEGCLMKKFVSLILVAALGGSCGTAQAMRARKVENIALALGLTAPVWTSLILLFAAKKPIYDETGTCGKPGKYLTRKADESLGQYIARIWTLKGSKLESAAAITGLIAAIASTGRLIIRKKETTKTTPPFDLDYNINSDTEPEPSTIIVLPPATSPIQSHGISRQNPRPFGSPFAGRSVFPNETNIGPRLGEGSLGGSLSFGPTGTPEISYNISVCPGISFSFGPTKTPVISYNYSLGGTPNFVPNRWFNPAPSRSFLSNAWPQTPFSSSSENDFFGGHTNHTF
jgi:hypothetical protein